jgi:predicted GTPase
MADRRRILILGAAGRDFHDFNVRYRNDPQSEVVAFTAAQIPGIDSRRYPASLAGPLYPQGIPVLPEAELEACITQRRVDEVLFAYSDLSHAQVMHLASRALACGASFRLAGPRETSLESRRPVVAVLASRTGAGKSTLTRHLAGRLREAGLRPVAVRHPMPYGDLTATVECYWTTAQVAAAPITIEAMEEYAQHTDLGIAVLAGVDYAAVLQKAEAMGDVVLWDGGNNDFSFVRPDVTVTVVDPTRPGEAGSHFPGEVNVRAADFIVVNKVNAVNLRATEACIDEVVALNPRATIVRMASMATMDHPDRVVGRRALVVEDGPSLTHGGMREAAGADTARAFGATLVDPRPHAVGSIAAAYRAYPHIGAVLPALGYSAVQRDELQRTIAAAPCDVVVVASPAPIERLIAIAQPVVRVRFDAREADDGPTLAEQVIGRVRALAGQAPR